jgi:hypothetical protein
MYKRYFLFKGCLVHTLPIHLKRVYKSLYRSQKMLWPYAEAEPN